MKNKKLKYKWTDDDSIYLANKGIWPDDTKERKRLYQIACDMIDEHTGESVEYRNNEKEKLRISAKLCQ